MPVTERRTFLPGLTPAEVYDWHLRPGSFEQLVPPWHRVRLVSFPEPFAAGGVAELLQSLGPLRLPWRSVLVSVDPGRGFVDEAEDGPFARWEHTHAFEPAPGGTTLIDRIVWALPLRPLGGLVGDRYATRQIEAMLAYRHERTAMDLSRWVRTHGMPRLRVGITGASGLVGSALGRVLTGLGHEVVPFVRGPAGPGAISWDPRGGVLAPQDLVGLHAIVHLAGESIAQRWTPAAKERIRGSRIEGTATLARAIAASTAPPPVLVSASAVGVYGDRREPVDATSPAGTGFLAEVGLAWEAAADPARAAGVRVVHPRIGIVQSARGGALAAQLPLYRACLGGPIGSGAQGVSWVALDDLVAILHQAIRDPRIEGVLDAVAPAPVSQADYARTLGRVLGRPALLPAPALAIRAIFGEMGDETILQGARVHPQGLHALDFAWRFPHLEDVLRWELGRRLPTAGDHRAA